MNTLLPNYEGCLKDVIKASKMEGLEQRKYITDLVKFDCVIRVPGVFDAKLIAVRQIGEGPEAIRVRKVHLIGGAAGWVLDSSVYTRDQLEATLKKMADD